jgi:hypothetical protein
MLELDAITGRKGRDGQPLSPGYVHGDLFGAGGVEIVPDNPRGVRSSSLENGAKGRGDWNTYDVVAIDGVIKLAVNGKFVNSISKSDVQEGLFVPGIRRQGDSLPQHQDHGTAPVSHLA